jgi:hypothetical protein
MRPLQVSPGQIINGFVGAKRVAGKKGGTLRPFAVRRSTAGLSPVVSSISPNIVCWGR